MQDVDAKRYFNEAVDPDALGIPEYRTIIKVYPVQSNGQAAFCAGHRSQWTWV